MKKTEEYFKELLEYRKENKIDPFNFCLLKFASWEASINARLKENSEDVTPRIIELISQILEEYVEKEDIEQIAELQTKLTVKYSENLLEIDKKINEKVSDYLDLYNEALARIMETSDSSNGSEDDSNSLN